MNKPDISKFDYQYGIFKKIGAKYDGPNSKYWTNEQIKYWMDLNDIKYEESDKRIDLVERIKDAGYK